MLNIPAVEISIIARVLVAVFLGLMIGIQRERRKLIDKIPGVAGLRTHTLICIGAALVSAVGAVLYPENIVFLAASIMTGIGFIGAGSVIAAQGKIKGLVNAVSIWITGVIGLTAGLGLYFAAVSVTVISIAILALKKFEKIE